MGSGRAVHVEGHMTCRVAVEGSRTLEELQKALEELKRALEGSCIEDRGIGSDIYRTLDEL